MHAKKILMCDTGLESGLLFERALIAFDYGTRRMIRILFLTVSTEDTAGQAGGATRGLDITKLKALSYEIGITYPQPDLKP